jgi:hypothetical protein
MDKPGFAPSFLRAAFYAGALWGFAEATLGYILHLARVPGLPGAVMAPIGLLLMGRAFVRTGRTSVIPAVALTAAAFKLSTLLVPGINVLAVINPVQAILLESIAATAVALVFGRFAGFPEPSRNFRASSGTGRGPAGN